MDARLKLFVVTALAMAAFAANSILARLALTIGDIGPWSFTLIRIAAGAVVLAILVGPKRSLKHGRWTGGVALLAYAGFFSFAYITLPAGTGALLLFAAVQITMLGAGLFYGERLSLQQGAGGVLAISGLVYLLLPGVTAPSLTGAAAMIVSGVSWGVYSLLGRDGSDSTAQTAGNFVRAVLIASLLSVPIFYCLPEAKPATDGVFYAIVSGAITSGLGYAIWYAALKSLKATTAGFAQLTVPPLAAIGGILFLNETMTLRLGLATVIVLLGVAMATLSAKPRTGLEFPEAE